MKEIRLIRSRLQTKVNNLLSADNQIVEKRLDELVSFIESTPILKTITSEFPIIEIDWSEWEKGLWHAQDFGIPSGDANGASFCWAVITKHKGQSLQMAMNIPMSTRNINEMLQSYFENFLPFVSEYLDNKLQEIEESVTPLDMVNTTTSMVDEKLEVNNPEIHSRLNDVYKKLYIAETIDEFLGIANACRSIVVDFASSIYKPEYLPKDQQEPKSDDAKTKLKYTFRKLNHELSSTLLSARETIIQGIWEVINVSVHRKSIDKSDIKEVVLFTYLLLNFF